MGEKHSLFSIDGILFGMGVNKGGLLGVGHDGEIMNSTPVLNLEVSLPLSGLELKCYWLYCLSES